MTRRDYAHCACGSDQVAMALQALTTNYDNLPFWSPDGSLIAFTRKHDGFNDKESQ